VRLEKDFIQVDGKEVTSPRKIYLVMNKPRGIVTTASDEKGRRTVYGVLAGKSVAEDLPWIAPVGRLDKASEGLLLLTNDSEWATRVLAPETHLPKTYHVQIAAVPDEALLQSLENGAHSGGDFLHARGVRILRAGKRNSWLEVILDEGKNRQIRRLLDHHGIEVLRLVRVAIGPLSLGKVAKGAVRQLTKEEKISIDRAMLHVAGQYGKKV
jgi:23S rRNA pseudouridine2605 synthase